MHLSRPLRRLAAVVLAAGLGVTVTGCGGSSTPSGTGTPTSPRTSALGTGATPTGPAGLHGLVAVDTPVTATAGAAVEVFDPRTGTLTRTLRVGFDVAPDAVFSADWNLLATDMRGLSGPHGIILGRRSGDTYVQIGAWVPQASLTGGLQQYAGEVFNRADGRLWFARRGLSQMQPTDGDVWFSVDPARPDGAPRQEQHAPPTTDPAGQVVQPRELKLGVQGATTDTVATVTDSSGGPLSATVEGSLQSSTAPGPAFLLYTCRQRISARELLCVGDGSQDAAGSVVGLTVPAQGAKAVLRQIFPPAADGTGITGAYLSPDGTSVLLGTRDGWFLGPVTGSTAPTQAFPALVPQPRTVVGWY